MELSSGAEPYFSTRDQRRPRKDLFDRERELAQLDKQAEQCTPLVALVGIRRIGKTSLLRAFLEEWTGIYIDLRGVTGQADLYNRVADGLYEARGKLGAILSRIRGLEVSLNSVRIKWRGRDSLSLAGLLGEVNSKAPGCVIFVFDEIQSVRPPLSFELKQALAYAYDNLDNIMIVVSGSEIGLLHGFLGVADEDSPLYGRYYRELVVDRFPEDVSWRFLEEGFLEEGVQPSREIIDVGVSLFDGIVGWLVFYGRSIIDESIPPRTIYEKAVRIALSELEKLPERDKLVLRAIAEGARSWSQVRTWIADHTGEAMPKSSLTRAITRLERLSLVQDYRFLDRVYEEAAKRLRVGRRDYALT